MLMPMVFVRIVWMRMAQRPVCMCMRVRFRPRLRRVVLVLMVRVMNMLMFVRQANMGVLVIVTFGEVQPQPGAHQHPRSDELNRHGLAKERHRDQGSDKGSDGEVRRRARSPEIPQGNHE